MSSTPEPAKNRDQRISQLTAIVQTLTDAQLLWIERTTKIFATETKITLNPEPPFTSEILADLAETTKIHHAFSLGPFGKDKFEYAIEQLFRLRGVKARLAPTGNPGHDVTVDGIKISLKTQADDSIKENEIHISKYMELGKGDWSDKVEQLAGLRDRFLKHLENYEKIYTLRTLKKPPKSKKDEDDHPLVAAPKTWRYELVEIPKELLLREGEFEMMMGSTQNPKPGYCYVRNGRNLIYSLYFDGGTERKLQIKNLSKAACRVLADWEFTIPPVV